MGVGIGRIEKEFILKAVSEKEMPVTLYGHKREYQALITGYDDDKVTIESEDTLWEDFSPGDPVSVFFSYYGHFMTFSTEVRYVQDEKLQLNYPEGIYKNLQRKYIRVSPPAESKVSFILKGTKIELDFPKTEEFNAADVLEYSTTFNSTNISELITGFKEKVGQFVSTHRVVMFREKKPEEFEEKLIANLGRSLFIPSTVEGFLVDEPSAQAKSITKKDVENALLSSGVQEQNIPIRMSVILSEKKNKGIHAEIWCPVLYREYAIGYVYASNRDDNEEPFDVELLEYMDQFAKVLAYSLKVNGYFKGVKPKDVNYTAEIIDISASGLLFSHSSKELSSALMLYTDLDLNFELGNKKMRIPVRVMRKFSNGGVNFFGVLFLDMKEDDFKYLFELVYGKQYTDKDEEIWEGGAPAPEVDLFT